MLVMIKSFKDKVTEDIFNGLPTKQARKVCPFHLWPVARRKLDQLDSAELLTDMEIPPGNQLEPLFGSRLGSYSIRINRQYRVCFKWSAEGPYEVEITDYH